MLAVPGAWATRFLPPPFSLAASFNLACWLSPVPGRLAPPGPALPTSISLATSFNLVCFLAPLLPQRSVSPAPLAPARRFRPSAVLPTTTEEPCSIGGLRRGNLASRPTVRYE